MNGDHEEMILARWAVKRLPEPLKRLLLARMDADDLIGEALVALCKARAIHDPQRGKLTTIFSWCVSSHFGGLARRWGLSRRNVLPVPLTGEEQAPACEDDGARLVEIKELADRALQCLTATEKLIVRLKVFEGREVNEVAAVLGLSRETARAKYNRAVRKMRRSLCQPRNRKGPLRAWKENNPEDAAEAHARGISRAVLGRAKQRAIMRRLAGIPDLPPLCGRIVSLLRDDGGEVRATEIADRLGCHRVHCRKLLGILTERGLIERTKRHAKLAV